MNNNDKRKEQKKILEELSDLNKKIPINVPKLSSSKLPNNR
jgi:hypothetical protein